MEHRLESTPIHNHRSKFLAAGAAMATAGVLAVNPVMNTPVLSERHTPNVELSAFENPFAVWQKTVTNTFATLNTLGTDISTEVTALPGALNPTELLDFVHANLTNPLLLPTALADFPSKYGDRLSAGAGAGFTAIQDALAELPAVLELSAGFLAEGKFLEAFAETNYWFLTAVLSDGRAGLLDVLRIPGDFAEDIGAGTLARILGTSWMDAGTAGPGYGPGLLSRGVIGNLGRALLAPQVTAIIQTMEILDATRQALQDNDFQTAASEVINAPAKIANAFLNGYVPKFVQDGTIPPGPGQSFPGLFSKTGTFDFFFAQVPREITKTLNLQRPESTATLAAKPLDDISLGNNVVALPLRGTDGPLPVKVADRAASTDSTDLNTANTVSPAPADGTADTTATTPSGAESSVNPSEPVAQNLAAKAAQRQNPTSSVRAEKARSAAERVRSTIRNGLGVTSGAKATSANDTGTEDTNSGTKVTSTKETSSRPKATNAKDTGSRTKTSSTKSKATSNKDTGSGSKDAG